MYTTSPEETPLIAGQPQQRRDGTCTSEQLRTWLEHPEFFEKGGDM